MPRFYGDSMNITPKEGQYLEEAMVIRNTSIDSRDVDFGYDTLSEEDKSIIEFAMSELKADEL